MDVVERFEQCLLGRPLAFPPVPRDVEWRVLPPMVDLYRDMVLGHLPPLQQAFADRVVNEMLRHEGTAAPTAAVHARACRTYPTLVRQHHFALLLQHRTLLESVLWIPWLDYAGIDLLVLHRGFAVGVALSVRTDYAAFWQSVKRERHPEPDGLRLVRLDVQPRAHCVGDFWLHAPADVRVVVDAMRAQMLEQRTGVLMNRSEMREFFEALKSHGLVRGKQGFDSDVWPLLDHYNSELRDRAWGRGPAQPSLPGEFGS